ncbi:MAG: hypothetical protein CHACPFDD_02517 [Phycisphaerae bacterium]|nr:hypothetical protein [Phycisphaerae bacterium]
MNTKAFGLLVVAAPVFALAAGCGLAPHGLEQGFRDPPAVARPHTWWHWMNGNVTREGITADLEAMKQIGLGGAQIFNVSEAIPEGPISIMSPEWRALVQHAAKEADRLGIELCMHNCPGWSSSGGPWVAPEFAMQTVVTSETAAHGPTHFSAVLPQPETRHGFYRDVAVLAFPSPREATTRIKDVKAKAGYEYRYDQQPALDAYPAAAVIRPSDIVDLTNQLDHDGRLTWAVPAGDWTILRVGHTPTGAVCAPAPASGRGLECDKLSRAGLDAHWAGMMGPILADLGPLAGKTLNNCLVDSYEMGGQNWTPRFREEFKRRRGYDPLPYLPTFTGRVVEGGEVSERFLWDLRRTIADLFADNYYTYFAELCHKHGMRASIEPYDGPFECLLAGRDADIPMGEFWVGGGESNSCKLAASVAHTYGRTIVGAESFTAVPSVGRWLNHPASLKAVGDLMYCAGINRYIIHRYAHQPWLDRYPGMTMGQWGTHFERTTTWWRHGGPEWVRYLARCQFMLQQGRFVADVCYFAGEAAPNGAPHHPELKARGYDYDACNADVLLNRASVRDGRVVLRDGMSYQLLVLPDTPFMTPALAAKVRELVRGGATVLGPKPRRSPSLSGFPDCDAQVRAIGDEVWADCDGQTVKERRFGNGRVICGRSVEEVLAAQNVKPDCQISGSSGAPKTAWIHRVSGDAHVYFVSNQKPRGEQFECTFRVSGKLPELWQADGGVITPAPVWSETGGLTTVDIPLEAAGSVFVVFRKPAAGVAHLTGVETRLALERPTAPKIEIQKAVYEATDGAGGSDVTAKVAALVAAGETSIPANNATFGDPTYMHVKRLRVDYVLDGKPLSRTAAENEMLDLVEAAAPPAPPTYVLAAAPGGKVELTAFQPDRYTLKFAGGGRSVAEVGSVAAPIELGGPWTLRFPSGWGAPASVQLDKLDSWTRHADPGVRYFSGTAEYETTFDVAPELLSAGRALYLDLGQVGCIAEVSLNGTDLGAWWKPPFVADVTRVATPGRNRLLVRVTNLWVNRLIGDEQHPDDCEWTGITLKRWPQWLLDGTPRPTRERLTFTTWKHWKRDAQLLDSGLMGPVMLRPAARSTIAIDRAVE